MRRLLSTILILCLAVLPVWAYTEYQQGQTSSTFRGPVVFFNSTSSGAVPISSSNPLPVSLPSSGSASNVNLTQYDSMAVGATNALHVQPGTSATFAATQSGTWNINNISGTVSLPTGASTAANQTTANTSLSSIDGKITACNTGATTISTFPDNEPFNLAQIAGNTVSTGNGASGTGVVRVAQVSDGTGILAGVTTITTLTGGGIAHDSADSGNPHKIGGRAQSTNNAAAGDNDRVDAFLDTQGRQIVEVAAPAALTAQQRTTVSNTSETTIVTAGGADVFNDILTISCLNTSATATYITIKDSTGGTNRWDIPCPANKLSDGVPFTVPLAQATANNNWTATAADTVSSLLINVQYRKRK